MKCYPPLMSLVILAFLLSACGGNADVPPTADMSISDVYTAAAMTLTAQAGSLTSTSTPFPTATPTIWASATIVLSTPTMRSASVFSSTANGCYDAAYVSDVTIPDGTVLAPGETFTKTWKFQNTGSCDWYEDFVLTFETCTDMDGEDTVIGEEVASGKTGSFSITLVAPETEGTYTGYWRLTTDSGNSFGQSVFVLIVVSEDAYTSTPTPTEETSADETSTATSTSTPIPEATSTPVPTDIPTSAPTETSEATEPIVNVLRRC